MNYKELLKAELTRVSGNGDKKPSGIGDSPDGGATETEYHRLLDAELIRTGARKGVKLDEERQAEDARRRLKDRSRGFARGHGQD